MPKRQAWRIRRDQSRCGVIEVVAFGVRSGPAHRGFFASRIARRVFRISGLSTQPSAAVS
jgi:hypothetical protein